MIQPAFCLCALENLENLAKPGNNYAQNGYSLLGFKIRESRAEQPCFCWFMMDLAGP